MGRNLRPCAPNVLTIVKVKAYIKKLVKQLSIKMTPFQKLQKKTPQVGLRACNNLPQPNPYIFILGFCRRLLHALNPTCGIYILWHGVIPTSYFILYLYVLMTPPTVTLIVCSGYYTYREGHYSPYIQV